MDNNVPYLYSRDMGWVPDSVLLEYLYLGEGDSEAISGVEAQRLISLMDRGVRIIE